MDNFKSQIIHVVETVDKLDLPDRIEALSYLQKITDAFKSNALPSGITNNNKMTSIPSSPKTTSKTLKHKCRNQLCLTYNIKHLKKVSCFKCEKKLENEYQLFEHSQTHLDFPLSCIHCHCTFRNIEDFNCHKLNYCKSMKKNPSVNSEKYSCTVCSSNFSNKKTFQSHLLDNHGVKLYNNWYGCKLCREIFEQKKILFHHYKLVHSKTNYQLKIKQEDNSKEKNDNILYGQTTDVGKETDIEKFQCYHCQKCFEKKYLLRIHMKRHINHKLYSCNVCKKSFHVYRYYRRHLQSTTHLNKSDVSSHPLFKCEKCDNKVFTQRDALARHILRFHQAMNKHLKCPLCDFTTGFESSLNRHINLHTDNRKFICDQCGACFHTHSALKDHTTGIHSNERNYSCEICGQRFKLKSGLNRHFKTHSDEKDFKCFCGQVYKFRTNLRRHLWNAHKMKSDRRNQVFRVSTEDEGYAMNNPKMVQRKSAKQKKTDDVETNNKLDDFDITSLTALSDVDLSCADDVLRETYDNFTKYSTVHEKAQESFHSILEPGSNLIDHVLQENNHELKNNRLMSVDDSKPYTPVTSDSFNQHLPPLNFRVSSCRQHFSGSFMETYDHQYSQNYGSFMETYDHQYSQNNCKIESNAKMDTSQCLNSLNSLASIALWSDAYNKQYSNNPYPQEVPTEDETSFSYTRWLNEIL